MFKFIKMNENKVVIGLLILSMSIIVCLIYFLRLWSWGIFGVLLEVVVFGVGFFYWLILGCLCCFNFKGITIVKF